MKKILYITAALIAAACSGTIDPENDSQTIPDAYTKPYTLSVDTTEVEANGRDSVTFSLKDAYGREMLTDKRELQNINIVSDKGTRVPRMKSTATFIDNGVYTFHAKYNGTKSENTVEVTARNRGKYEVFHRNVGLFKCTSVSCPACPGLGKQIDNLSEDAANHSVVLSIHGNYSGEDPFSLYVDKTDLGSYMIGYFGGSGWPTLVYDLDVAVTGGSTLQPASVIESKIMERRVNYPATCGIKVSAVTLEGNALKVDATMKSSTGGEYDLACAVLRDGLVYQGGYSEYNDGVYNDVVLDMSESFLAYYKGETVAAGAEISETFTFDFKDKVPSEDVLADYYVAVYAHRKTAAGSVMDNIVTCRYGKAVDYHLND